MMVGLAMVALESSIASPGCLPFPSTPVGQYTEKIRSLDLPPCTEAVDAAPVRTCPPVSAQKRAAHPFPRA